MDHMPRPRGRKKRTWGPNRGRESALNSIPEVRRQRPPVSAIKHRRGLASAMILAGFTILLALWLRPTSAAELVVDVTATTSGQVNSDWTSVYYSKEEEPFLLGNDGGAQQGGFRVYGLDDTSNGSTIRQITSVATGRTKLIAAAYDVGGRDIAITVAAPDSVIRLFELPSLKQIDGDKFIKLGDWSALCPWKSKSGNQYFYLFGKRQAAQFLIRFHKGGLEIVEVQSFHVPFEASGCATSALQTRMYLTTDDDKRFYFFPLKESSQAPKILEAGKAEDDITGIATYTSDAGGGDHLVVSMGDSIAVFDGDFLVKGTFKLSGLEDIGIQGLSIYQAPTPHYSAGVITYALESDNVTGYGITPLDGILGHLNLSPNTNYNPRCGESGCRGPSPICSTCSANGYCLHNGISKCECFSGFAGDRCGSHTCAEDCSSHGKCVGPNMCACDDGWGGLHCSFLLVEPSFETEANGVDGDDPAVWISPVSRNLSRVITTTKSEKGAGLGVFDLAGTLLQTVPAGEPNNVDVLYGFLVGNRTTDLAFAGCRADDTLCLFEVLPNGTLTEIPGGSQPVPTDFSIYGSCTYRSPTTGKQYLFVNEKSARYLQYELTASADGVLQTSLVRDFRAGSGGQVEGCVSDEENGWLFLGEEASALWKYGAEPDSSMDGEIVAKVGDGTLYADVEGVTLIYGSGPDKGFILVSCQGVSAYSVYQRALPHDHVVTFTIVASADGQVDAVSNTDGIAAVGTGLNDDFPRGLVVVHDDANQLPDKSTSAEASFKLVSLERILGAEQLGGLNLLEDLGSGRDAFH